MDDNPLSSLKEALQACVSSGNKKSPEKLKELEQQLYRKYLTEWRSEPKENHSSYDVIPKFYRKLPKQDDVLAQKLREEARAVFLQRRGRQLLNSNELKALWVLLENHHSPPLSDDEQLINYEDFLKVAEKGGPKCKHYFTPRVFAKLQHGDPYCRINIMVLFNYIMRKVWYHETRIGLSLYDFVGQGYLRELLRDVDLPKDLQDSNWFSAPSALRVYGQYLNLDKDHNGMLSCSELSGYGTGTLSKVFTERVFQECLTYDGEMDYKTYLDFVLAMENRQEPQSLHYLFKILDVHGKGYLDVFTLNYFFRSIQEQMVVHGQEPVSFEDVSDEIFDMVKPTNPAKITLQDLINCGQGDTVVSILIDLNDFWTYENREAISTDTNEASAEV
ncbi:serine/threonine-protein phosphatase 2A regulatory subunit B'' subunit gamma-like isoform X2 [Schistocerca serialis cubense]|uniref:serine/threonine-protein phosphatase 2A regulatory subunit B'' subunit gamma-like isoform X2 n=1 Tax=Schistocerca serialis cubense TaxID=2023355 RepID=UPI00214F5E79|nr:serine/threonine-protein phosphatase 2A regulatory subunit B'' subunit gamma-like isoform X2 [Schistocerca serialis cubense]